MAFGTPTLIGSGFEKTSDTSHAITVTSDVAVGQGIAVFACTDNLGTSDADTTQLSVTDSSGNTYARARERTKSSGSAADGITGGIWYTTVATSLTNASSTITVTSSSAVTAKALAAVEFTMGGGSTLTVEQTQAESITAGADPGSLSLTSLPSREYLILHMNGEERGATRTPDADYSEIFDAVETSGGGAATNVSLWGAYRIATLTSDAVDMASATDGDAVQVLVAFYEAAGGSDATVNQPAAGILVLTADTAAVNVSDSVTQPAAGILALTADTASVTYSGAVTQPAAGVLVLTADTASVAAGTVVTLPEAGIIRLTSDPPTLTGVVADTARRFIFNAFPALYQALRRFTRF